METRGHGIARFKFCVSELFGGNCFVRFEQVPRKLTTHELNQFINATGE
jgi:hypothetical protein